MNDAFWVIEIKALCKALKSIKIGSWDLLAKLQNWSEMQVLGKFYPADFNVLCDVALLFNLNKFKHHMSAKRKIGASQMPVLQVKQVKMGLFSSLGDIAHRFRHYKNIYNALKIEIENLEFDYGCGVR